MDARDDELLLRLKKVNQTCGEIAVHVFTTSVDDRALAASWLQLGAAFVHLGTELGERAYELDPELKTGEEWPVPRGSPQ